MDDYIDIYLEADKDCANVPEGWKKAANFSFAVTDQVNDKMTIRKGIFHTLVFLNFKFCSLFFCQSRPCNYLKTNLLCFVLEDKVWEERFFG